MTRRTYLPDRNAPLRKLTDEECRVSRIPPGSEVTATATFDDVISSGAITVFGKPHRR